MANSVLFRRVVSAPGYTTYYLYVLAGSAQSLANQDDPRNQGYFLMPTAKKSEGLLRQIAEHISKMQGGISIGGFSGFVPPDDEPRYQDKVRLQQYDEHDLNDWTKEINNFLRQIERRHPDLSLSEILRQHGKSEAECDDFIYYLQITQWQASGYILQSAESLGEIMQQLEVEPLWY